MTSGCDAEAPVAHSAIAEVPPKPRKAATRKPSRKRSPKAPAPLEGAAADKPVRARTVRRRSSGEAPRSREVPALADVAQAADARAAIGDHADVLDARLLVEPASSPRVPEPVAAPLANAVNVAPPPIAEIEVDPVAPDTKAAPDDVEPRDGAAIARPASATAATIETRSPRRRVGAALLVGIAACAALVVGLGATRFTTAGPRIATAGGTDPVIAAPSERAAVTGDVLARPSASEPSAPEQAASLRAEPERADQPSADASRATSSKSDEAPTGPLTVEAALTSNSPVEVPRPGLDGELVPARTASIDDRPAPAPEPAATPLPHAPTLATGAVPLPPRRPVSLRGRSVAQAAADKAVDPASTVAADIGASEQAPADPWRLAGRALEREEYRLRWGVARLDENKNSENARGPVWDFPAAP